MGAYGWLVVGAGVLLAAFSAALLLPLVVELAQSAWRAMHIRSKLAGVAGGKEGASLGLTSNPGNLEATKELLLQDLCTHGVQLLRVPARYALKFPPYTRLVDSVAFVMRSRILGCSRRAVAETLLALCVLCGLVLFVLTGQLFMALFAGLTPAFILQVKAGAWLKERKSKLREQLPDALRGLGMCFMAGLSLEQAFDQTAEECQEPLKRELRRTVDNMRTGSSVMEALEALDERLALDEMRFVSVALEIQHRTGGSMREVLDAAANSMFASFDLSRSLEVQTAQARMSARIVSILPLVLVAVLSVTMEGYLATFFSSPVGFALLLLAVSMEVLGILFIRKILGISLE